MSACKCSPCGREFTGLTAFDKHQDVDYSRRPAVVCKDPATIGLVRNDYGRWGEPMNAAGREWVQNLAAKRALARTPVTPGPSGPSESGGAP
jgi:hypothetical protein